MLQIGSTYLFTATEQDHSKTHNWAMTWQNQQNDCVPSEDSDQTGRMLGTQWVAKDPSLLHVDSEDSDQTGQSIYILLVLS